MQVSLGKLGVFEVELQIKPCLSLLPHHDGVLLAKVLHVLSIGNQFDKKTCQPIWINR